MKKKLSNSECEASSPPQKNESEMEGKRHSAVSVFELDLRDLKPTSFCGTLMNMIKTYLGCGILALGMAFKNGGLAFCLITFAILGYISCYNQHLLIKTANYIKYKHNFRSVSYGETIGVSFEEGSSVFKKCADVIRWFIKTSIVLLQFGACCAYFLFLSRSVEQICDCHDVKISIHLVMVYILPIIWIVAFIRELKYIAPLSTLANLSNVAALSVILHASVTDLGPISDRKLIGSWNEIPLAFGTMVFSLEGIAVSLPFQQNMEKKERFLGTFGVLNLSLISVMLIMEIVGFFGYYKYGEDVKESLTLNMDVKHNILAQGVILLMVPGILSSYALQFFVLILQFLPDVKKKAKNLPFYSCHLYEYLLRSIFVLFIFLTAQIVPHLDLLISLVGSIAGSALAFFFVPLADISLRKRNNFGILSWRMMLNIISIVIAVLGCILGTTISVKDIITAVKNDLSTISENAEV